MTMPKAPTTNSATSTPNDRVANVFKSYPTTIRQRLLTLRRLILETAADTPGVGLVEETLRWGEPSYITSKPKSGSTVRIGPVRGSDNQYAMYFNCQTTLVETFRTMYPDDFAYSGNRAILFDVEDEVANEKLAHCVAMALRYHLDK